MTKMRSVARTGVRIGPPTRQRALLASLLAFGTIATIATTGCTSPESTRVEAGGPGADTGNRSAVLKMHEGSKPFIGTPDLNPTEPPPLESAAHARDRSMQ